MIYIVLIALLLSAFIAIASFKIGWGVYMKSVCTINSSSKEIVLTYDDGPHPVYTPLLLDLLKKKEIKATFFLIGTCAEQYPEIVKRIVDEGHKIGVHSYYHNPKFTILSKRSLIKDLSSTKALLEKITGKEVSLFRPPYGVTNPNMAKAVNILKLKSIGWSIRSFDTICKKQDSTVEKIEKEISPGSIVLLHDRLPGCVLLTEKIIEMLERREYKTVNL